MTYTYNNGYREGVVFVFLKDMDQILVEHRPLDEENYETFFTSGSIETKDYKSNIDYRIMALKREINEEFQKKIKIKEYKYLNEIKVDEINVIFYVYLITEWEGNMPNFTIEEGKKHADLQWVKLEEKEKIFRFQSAFIICKRIEEYLKYSNYI